jgi:phenylpropionate dioxygenase-like ring-hydroxylating dioxygenase large terminal subunit
LTEIDPVLSQQWFVVARSQDVTGARPVAARLLGKDLVLWRAKEGVRAWLDLCIHRGAKLSLGAVSKDCLVCPYHGWQYNAAGRCVHIPAQPGVPPPVKAQACVFRVKEQMGFVWVCVGDAPHLPPAFDEVSDERFRSVIAGPYLFHAQGPRIIENFLDVAHLPIVHAGYLGEADRAELSDYEVEATGDGIMARDIAIWQPDPDGTGRSAQVRYTYQVHGPLVASFRKLHNGQSMLMAWFVTPLDEDHCDAWALLAMDYGHEIPDADIIAYQDMISSQDKPIVESQRPELLPLDLQAELHLRSDRAAVAYRRWLRSLGMSYGTA